MEKTEEKRMKEEKRIEWKEAFINLLLLLIHSSDSSLSSSMLVP
jgi:hypothetical protein